MINFAKERVLLSGALKRQLAGSAPLVAEGKNMAALQVPRPQVAPLVAKWRKNTHKIDHFCLSFSH